MRPSRSSRDGNTINTAPLDPVLMLDGREDNLEDQALGAVHAHYDNTEEPDANDLERLAQFQHTRQFFSSDELYEFDNGGPPPELPPGNTPAEIRGRMFFEPTGMCGKCHGGPMLNTRVNGTRFSTSLVTAPVMTVLQPTPPALRVRPSEHFVNRIARPCRILRRLVHDFGFQDRPLEVIHSAYFHNTPRRISTSCSSTTRSFSRGRPCSNCWTTTRSPTSRPTSCSCEAPHLHSHLAGGDVDFRI